MAKKLIRKRTVKSVKRKKNQGVDLSFMGSSEEPAESRTIASRKRIHDIVDADIVRFLKSGGKIKCVDPRVTGDPVKKPEYHYGERPI